MVESSGTVVDSRSNVAGSMRNARATAARVSGPAHRSPDSIFRHAISLSPERSAASG